MDAHLDNPLLGYINKFNSLEPRTGQPVTEDEVRALMDDPEWGEYLDNMGAHDTVSLQAVRAGREIDKSVLQSQVDGLKGLEEQMIRRGEGRISDNGIQAALGFCVQEQRRNGTFPALKPVVDFLGYLTNHASGNN